MKKLVIKLTTSVLIVIMLISTITTAFAHSQILTVGYDDCSPPKYSSGTIIPNQDGEDET